MPRLDLEPSLARLVIRAVETRAEPERRRLPRLVSRLFDWCKPAEQTPRPTLSVSVTDIEGRQVYAEENAGPSTTVPLPPGTYHVLARTRGVERRYTLVLAPQDTTDLHLRTPPGAG